MICVFMLCLSKIVFLRNTGNSTSENTKLIADYALVFEFVRHGRIIIIYFINNNNNNNDNNNNNNNNKFIYTG